MNVTAKLAGDPAPDRPLTHADITAHNERIFKRRKIMAPGPQGAGETKPHWSQRCGR